MWKQVQPRKGRARTRTGLLCLEVKGSSGLMGVTDCPERQLQFKCCPEHDTLIPDTHLASASL